MRRDIFFLRDHGSMWHIMVIVGLAHELRRTGWEVRTTSEIQLRPGINGAELDILAKRNDPKIRDGRRYESIRTVGIEVEESYSKNLVMVKYDKYLLHGIETLFVAVPKGTRASGDFGKDALNRPRDIRILKSRSWSKFEETIRELAGAIL